MKEHGTDAMTNAELLSIIIGNGTSRENALTIARKMLHSYGDNLNELGKASIDELKQIDGIGEFTACKLMAAIELGKRRQLETAMVCSDVSSATAVYNIMHPQMMDLDHEEAHVLLLNNNYKLIKQVRLSQGGITETAVDIRVIMKNALLNNATVIVLVHNHPSNNTMPSKDDDRLTINVKKACETMRIYFLDHIIICDGQYYSYRNRGRI
jgi:DNA repair protein RadC